MNNTAEFNCSVDTKPYKFGYYIREFSLYVSKRVPSKAFILDMDHEEKSVIGYSTIFEVSGIHHSNTEPKITQDMYINGNYMLLFDLIKDRGSTVTL